jgi:hypothetical protein
MDDRCPLTDPQPGDMVEAIIADSAVVCLVTMVIIEDIQPIIFDIFKDGELYPSQRATIIAWRVWCQTHNAEVRHKS